jgi:hypothetical protein
MGEIGRKEWNGMFLVKIDWWICGCRASSDAAATQRISSR